MSFLSFCFCLAVATREGPFPAIPLQKDFVSFCDFFDLVVGYLNSCPIAFVSSVPPNNQLMAAVSPRPTTVVFPFPLYVPFTHASPIAGFLTMCADVRFLLFVLRIQLNHLMPVATIGRSIFPKGLSFRWACSLRCSTISLTERSSLPPPYHHYSAEWHRCSHFKHVRGCTVRRSKTDTFSPCQQL